MNNVHNTMNKEQILSEIRRTAKANGGVALGWRRFAEETGIRYYDWYGKFWTQWDDAAGEAGFPAAVPGQSDEQPGGAKLRQGMRNDYRAHPASEAK